MTYLIVINLFIFASLILLALAYLRVKSSNKWTEPHRNFERNSLYEGGFLEEKERIGFKLRYFERLGRKYLQQTGLLARFPYVNMYKLFLLSCFSAYAVSKWIWALFKIEGLLISGIVVGFSIPFQVALLYGSRRKRLLIRGLPGFYSVLQRWAQIHEDIYYCLGQLENSGVDKRLSQPFTLFLMEATAGVSETDTFRHLEQTFQGTPVLQFVKCLEHMSDQRGDLVKLLQGFENESYQLQMEMSDRQGTQIKYRLLINGLSLAAFGLIYLLLNSNRVLSDFYVDTSLGKTLLSLLAFMMALSFLGGLKYEYR